MVTYNPNTPPVHPTMPTSGGEGGFGDLWGEFTAPIRVAEAGIGWVGNLPGIRQVITTPVIKATDFTSHVMSASALEYSRLFGGDPRATNPLNAWGDSEQVSPGQAVLSNPVFQQPLTQRLLGHEGQSPFKNTPLNAYGAVDVADPQVRKQAFESGGVGEVGSWATDALIQWYANPAVVAGMLAKGPIAVARGAETMSAAKRVKYAQALESTGRKLETGEPLVGREIGLADLYLHRGSLEYLLTRMNNRVANPEIVANGMHGARDFQEFSTIYMAATGDPVADEILKNTFTSLHAAMEQADFVKGTLRETRRTIPRYNDADGTVTGDWVQHLDDIRENQAVLRDTKNHSAWIQQVTGGNVEDTPKIFAALANTQLVSPIGVLNKVRFERANLLTQGWAGTRFTSKQIVEDDLAPGGVKAVPGIEFRPHTPVQSNAERAGVESPKVGEYPGLDAYINGEYAGGIVYRRKGSGAAVNPDKLEIHGISVEPNFRRQGVASNLVREVQRRTGETLYHSDDLSEDGRAFAEARPASRFVSTVPTEAEVAAGPGWGGLASTTIEATPGSRGVRFIAWASGRSPRGIIDVNSATGRQLWAVRDWMVSAKMDQETIRKWTTKFAQAPTPNAKQWVLVQADTDVMRKVFDQHLPDDAHPVQRANMKTRADELLKAYRVKADEALQAYKSQGWYVDAESNKMVQHQMFDSMQAQAVPLTNYARIHQILDEIGDPTVALKLQHAGRVGMDALSAFSTLWKAGVLLRVGALPKNLTESWLAQTMMLGHPAGNPISGSRNMAVGQYNRYRYKALTKDQPQVLGDRHLGTSLSEATQLLNGRLAEMEGAQNTTESTMADIVEASRAAGKATYYQGTPALGARLSHADVQMDIALGGSQVLSAADRTAYQGLIDAAGRRQLTKAERDTLVGLHAKAARKAIRGRVGKGQTAVVRRGGEYLPTAAKNITDTELFGSGVIRPGRFAPEPEVHIVPTYKATIKAAPKATETVDQFLRDNYPTPVQVYGQQALDDLAGLRNLHRDRQANIEQVRAAMVDLADLTRPPERVRAGMTPERAAVPSGRVYSGRGGGQGVVGQLLDNELGATTTAQTTMDTFTTQAARAREYDRQQQVVARSHIRYDPTHPDFYVASAEFANHMVRNSGVASLLMHTDNPDWVAWWLKHTDEGKAHLNAMNMIHEPYEEIVDYTHDAYRNLLAAYPNAQLRQAIVAGDVTPDMVRAYLYGRDDLVPTVAREFAPVTPSYKAFDKVTDATNAAYRWIWAMPEQRLARYPLYNTMYSKEWRRIVADNAEYLEGKSLAEANQWLRAHAEPRADSYAKMMTTKVIYTAQTRSNIPQKLRALSPFLQVTANRLYYYGSQVVENPHNVARMMIGWNGIGTTPGFNGQPMIVAHMPRWAAKLAGIEDTPDLPFTKDSFNLITGGSTPWYSPGWGPPVTTPITALIQHDPSSVMGRFLQSAAEKVGALPQGYVPTSLWDTVLPTWARRITAANGPQGARTLNNIFAIEMWKYENHLRPDKPTMAEINHRNNTLTLFRIAAAVTLPAQPQEQNAVLNQYQQIHTDYVKKYGQDADMRFYADFPNYYDLLVSSTKNPTNIQPNLPAYNRLNKYGATISELHDPGMAAMLTNLPGNDGLYDQSAYAAEINKPVTPGSGVLARTQVDPQTSYYDRVISRGWIEYRAAAKQRDALLAAAAASGGSRNINAKDNDWIRIQWAYQKWKIAKDTQVVRDDGSSFSPWLDDLQTQDNFLYAKRADTLSQMLRDPQVAHDSGLTWTAAGSAYLLKRDQIVKLLAQEKASGGSDDINAESNQWLKISWDFFRQRLEQENPVWQQWQERYFANDDLGVVPHA